MNNEKRAYEVMITSPLMALATVGEDGRPWIVIVQKKEYHKGVFRWESRVGTDHSKHVQTNKYIALTLWSGEEIVKVRAEAKELSRDDTGLGQYEATMTDVKYSGNDRVNYWLDVEKLQSL